MQLIRDITRSLLSAVLGGCLLFAVPAWCQQQYPTKPIRLVIPYPAGAGVDIAARIVAPALPESLGQPVVIDNRAGAGGVVGTEAVAHSAADGYTLLLADAGPLAINPSVNPKLPYDPIKDFTPIVIMATLPTLLLAHPSLQVKTVQELIAAAKQRPRQISYASGGTATSAHLAMELLMQQAGIEMLHVPYKGTAPALAGVLSGNPSVMFGNLASSRALIDAGKLVALAIASPNRSDAAPEVPTVAESGLAGYAVETWFGVVGPANLPGSIVNRLNDAFRRALSTPEVKDRLAKVGGMQAVGGSPDEFGRLLRRDIDAYGNVVRSAKIKLD